jgi:hypothetical protein
VVATLRADEFFQVIRTAYVVYFARTVASIHYTTDSIAGLNLGLKILADKRPYDLSEKHDPQVVQ